MNKPQVFQHSIFGELPVIIFHGVEWFGATESAKALSFADPYTALRNHVEEDDLLVQPVIDSLGRKQQKKFTNESGLYSLIFGAAKQGNNAEIKSKAKEFKRWVTGDVLPTIRKHGAYMTNETIEKTLTDPDYLIQLANTIKAERTARLAAEAKIEADRPKVLFAESLQVSQDSILIGELAKVLKQNGIDIGQNRLFRLLREEGYLIKYGEQYNMPTQRSMELQLMEIKTGSRNSSDGTIKITRTPKITGKGQIYFVNKFKKRMQAS